MPSARSHSPGFASPQAAADRALVSSDGVDVKFTVARCGTPDVARVASRRFQVGFCALRARARRRDMRAKGQLGLRDTDAIGIYDTLVCNRSPLGDDGSWVVSLVPIPKDLASMDIVDRASGLSVHDVASRTLSPAEIALKFNANYHKLGKWGGLSLEEYNALKAFDPDWFENYTPLGDPGPPPGVEPPSLPPRLLDPIDASEEDMRAFFGKAEA